MLTKSITPFAPLAACTLLLMGACRAPERTTILEIDVPPGTAAADVHAAARIRNLGSYAPHGDTLIFAPASKRVGEPFLGFWVVLDPVVGRAQLWAEAYPLAPGTTLPRDMGLIDNNTPSAHGDVIAEEEDRLGAWSELRALGAELGNR
jgi:hypothetical protein